MDLTFGTDHKLAKKKEKTEKQTTRNSTNGFQYGPHTSFITYVQHNKHILKGREWSKLRTRGGGRGRAFGFSL